MRTREKPRGSGFGMLTALIFGALVFMRSGWADVALTGAGAKIFIDFTDDTNGNVLFTGTALNQPIPTLSGLAVSVNVNGLEFDYTLDANGEAANTPDFFELRVMPSGQSGNLSFTFNAQAAGLLTAFAGVGLTNTSAANQAVSIDATVTFNGIEYSATLPGVYDAVAGKSGTAYLGIIAPPKNPAKPPVYVKSFLAAPNPVMPTVATTFKSSLSVSGLTGTITGELLFGDGTAPVSAPAATFTKMLSKGVTHAYSFAGVYIARLTLTAGNDVIVTRQFVVVGTDIAVNARLGLVSQYDYDAGSSYYLFNLTVDNVPSAVNAATVFLDVNANTSLARPSAVARISTGPQGIISLSPGNSFAAPGLYVAQSLAVDAQNNLVVPASIIRKTIAVGANDVDPASSDSQGSPRNADAEMPIALGSMKGKFMFGSAKSDTVAFNGTIPLPAGFAPKNPGGNDYDVSIGNVIDVAHLNAQGKLVLPTAKSLITVFKLTPPKLPNGIAAGGEIAKLSFTMSATGLTTLGFNSEGITNTTRLDEQGMASVQRFVQINMVVAGVTYSVLAPVQYTVATNSDFGTISGRN